MSNFLQNFKTTFSDIENRVNEISATENSYIVSSPNTGRAVFRVWSGGSRQDSRISSQVPSHTKRFRA